MTRSFGFGTSRFRDVLNCTKYASRMLCRYKFSSTRIENTWRKTEHLDAITDRKGEEFTSVTSHWHNSNSKHFTGRSFSSKNMPQLKHCRNLLHYPSLQNKGTKPVHLSSLKQDSLYTESSTHTEITTGVSESNR